MPNYVPRKVARAYFEAERLEGERIVSINRTYGLWCANADHQDDEGQTRPMTVCAWDDVIAEWQKERKS